MNFERMLELSPGRIRQFFVLTRHFFRRLFLNDFISFEEQMQQSLIAVLVIIAIFSGHLANILVSKYMFVPDEGSSWVEKCYFIFFCMVVIGFISVLEWDVIFPDARDFSNLMPLPVSNATLMWAKFTSLFLFVSLFALATNAISAFAFWFHLTKWHSNSILYGIRFFFVHVGTVFIAQLFIFFFSIFFLGMLMSILGTTIFRAVSVYIRAVLMIFFVFLLIFFVVESVGIPHAFSDFPKLKENNSLFLYLFPPMWFVGLYEILLGNRDFLFLSVSKWAVVALVVPLLGFFLAAGFNYRRYVIKTEEARGRRPHFVKIKFFLGKTFDGIFLRNSIQRAIFYFFGRTLRRSSPHRMRIASYLAVSAGLVLILLASRLNGIEGINADNMTVLSIPFFLSFFLIVGLRASVAIPASLDANWIFKLIEFPDKRHYFLGLKKGILWFTLIPLFFLMFIFYLFLWGWKITFFHCFYGLLISIFLMEIAFFNFRKIPFACSYVPGKFKMHIFWMVYLISFLSYVYIPTLIEQKLLRKPSELSILCSLILVIIAFIRIYERYFIYKKSEVVYEEEPEAAMITLTSSE